MNTTHNISIKSFPISIQIDITEPRLTSIITDEPHFIRHEQGDFIGDCFEALGTNQAGEEYLVRWHINSKYLDEKGFLRRNLNLQEIDLCDWKYPFSIEIFRSGDYK